MTEEATKKEIESTFSVEEAQAAYNAAVRMILDNMTVANPAPVFFKAHTGKGIN